ncbi:DUF3108 domain-containing protein [Roseovarius nanhaiticus]|uniref:DUF3108 domain-containing protein n=1 Tax=Roseovarius nanhaiticus TaxID=573024 RepID=UPI0024926CB0|nr:DUF3108 domain-containing protein [Roseovarius nanhaiticus]
MQHPAHSARLGLMATLICLALPLRAEDSNVTYDVRLLGLPVGKMKFAARERGDAYAVTGLFSASGIGRIADAGFRLSATGRIRNGALAPRRYDEKIDTGSRSSTAQLSYEGGVPRLTGGSVMAEVAADPGALNPAQQRGTVDPLTALWGVLRDRPAAGICRYDVVIFDGQRRSRLAMTGGGMTGSGATCTGAYTRLAGFSASEMKRQTVYPFTVTYTSQGGEMRAEALSVKSAYGTASMTRE